LVIIRHPARWPRAGTTRIRHPARWGLGIRVEPADAGPVGVGAIGPPDDDEAAE
jgi:hypothetical protein